VIWPHEPSAKYLNHKIYGMPKLQQLGIELTSDKKFALYLTRESLEVEVTSERNLHLYVVRESHGLIYNLKL
jgi:hypothetical protein